MKKLFYTFILALLLNGCETPESQNLSDQTFISPDLRETLPNANLGNFSSELNDLMNGPTRDSDCSNPHNRIIPNFKLGKTSGTPKPIKKEEQVYWNECSGNPTANYHSDGVLQPKKCSKRRKMSREFFQFFEENFSACTIESLAKVRGKGEADAIERIHFSHRGVAGDTRHSNRSLHSINRAIDIAKIHIVSNGRNIVFDAKKQHSGDDKVFYKQFRHCWDRSITQYQGNCSGSSYPVGSIGYEDRQHREHVHTSLPKCNSNYYSKENVLASTKEKGEKNENIN